MPVRPTERELDEFLTRAVSEVFVRDDLKRALATGERRLRVKQGFDPTRPNLHLGHVVCLRKLRTLAEWGHEIVIIIGDYTTQIGDPTDQDETRPTMSHEEVLANAQTYLEQFHRIVPHEGTRIVYQTEWYGGFGLKDVIHLAARFSAQQMLAREEFRKRIAAKTPIPIKDLLYPLLQAYDSVAIESDLEVGGTDQQFNVLAGRELQEKIGQRPQNVFIMELLEGLDGEKMSKSKPATGIWLTDPPNEMFGKLMAIKDELMPHYFEWATELPLDEVQATLAALADGTLHPRDAKMKLARQVVSELHSAAAAAGAEAAFVRTFRDGARPAEVPELRAARPPATAIVDVLTHLSVVTSRGEARRLVEQGGVRIDGERATLATTVDLERGETDLQIGVRRFWRVVWEPR